MTSGKTRGVRTGAGMQQLAERFGDLLDSMPDGVVIVDSAGRIVRANSKAEEMFGYPPGSLTGQPVERLLPTRLHAAHIRHRSGYVAQPRVREMGPDLELFGVRRDGTEVPVEIRLSPLPTESGVLIISAIRDVTDRKRIERTLQEKNLELAQAVHTKDLFLATVSHELRTPLNAIIGFTGTLLMRLPGPLLPEQERQLRTVQANSRHLLAVINDILDLAKIESGRVELSCETTDCRQVIREIANTVLPAASAKGIDFTLSLPEDDVIIQTDRRALTQIVLNLASNAVKFTDRGGVCVRLGYRHKRGDRTIAIAVKDTGIGIRAEDQQKLFHAFGRLKASSRHSPEGTGLGLHLSQRLAELLGGRITVASEYRKGSTFTLEIGQSAFNRPAITACEDAGAT